MPSPSHGDGDDHGRPAVGWWAERVVPRLVDRALKGREVGELRAEVCRELSGEVLEIGFGGGLNLVHLPAGVNAVHAVEPSDLGWSLSERRRHHQGVPVERVGLDGERLEADDGRYDHVLCTFTLCTVPDPALVLAEAARVLRPGGSFAYLEHGLAPTPRMAGWQRRLDGVQRRAFAGCHLSRDVPALLEGSPLDVVRFDQGYQAGPASPWSYVYRGIAERPASSA